MKKRIAIIGAGQLGSRHLQSLAKLEIPAEISVVDPSPASLAAARERFEQIPANPDVASVSFLESLDLLGSALDLAVIATNADVRADLVRRLLAKADVPFMMLEKVVFQEPADFESIAGLLAQKGTQAWVNCPRRMYPFYQELHRTLEPLQPLHYAMQGGEWGLCCNSVHFVDHLAFLTGCPDFNVAFTDEPEILESKRKGFWELAGSLTGTGRDGSSFVLRSMKGTQAPPVIDILGRRARAVLNEFTASAHLALEKDNWSWKALPCAIPYQSELTHLAARSILETGTCALTAFEESSRIHKPLLECFAREFSRLSGGKIRGCPIT